MANFPDKQCSPELQKRYNKTIGECIDGVRDFLTLHYCASSRYDTPFWKATKHDLKLSDDLKERLAEWKVRLPNPRNINPNYHGFESYSYAVMLQGLGYRPEACLPVLEHMDSTRALEAFRRIRERTNDLIKTLPSQYEYLTSVRVGQTAGVM